MIKLAVTVLGVILVHCLPEQVRAEEVKMITPSICPVICSETDSREFSDNGIIGVLENALSELGHYLVIDFDTESRSQVKAAMGLSDLTMGTEQELARNARLNTIAHQVGDAPLQIVYAKARPVTITSLDDLANYRVVWHKGKVSDPRFVSVVEKVRSKGQLVPVPSKDFLYNALSRIHSGDADVVLVSETQYEEVMPRFMRAVPEANFAKGQAQDTAHSIIIAFSGKTSLTEQEQQHIREAIEQFDFRAEPSDS